MKRREMIYLMVESMEYWQDSLSKFGGGIPAMMDYVLEQQEKAGMKAPEYEYIDDKLPHHDNVILKNEWEPESE